MLSHRRYDRGGHTGAVLHIAFHPSSRLLASCGGDQRVKVWDVGTLYATECKSTFHKHDGWVYSCAFSHTGSLLASACADQVVRIFDLSTLQLLQPEKRGILGKRVGSTDKEVITFKGPVLSLDFSPEDSWICAGAADNKVSLWRVSDGECYQTFEGHADWVTSVRFSPDGMMILSASYDGTAKIWRVSDGHQAQSFEGHTNFVSGAEWGERGQLVATGSGDHTVRVWDADEGKELLRLEGHTSWVLGVAFAPRDNLLASCSADTLVILWDCTTGMRLKTIAEHTDWVESLSFDPTGLMLATAGHDRAIHLWDVAEPTAPELKTSLVGRKGPALFTWLYYKLVDLNDWLLGTSPSDEEQAGLLDAIMDQSGNQGDPKINEMASRAGDTVGERAMALVRDDVQGLDVRDQVTLATLFLKFAGEDDKVPKNLFANACLKDPVIRELLKAVDETKQSVEEKMRARAPYITWDEALECFEAAPVFEGHADSFNEGFRINLFGAR
mmetsp:Transcript_7788/g.22751  ORF Transcript_7788/g.22751 Transcript_7788/m.22751 type:complete len:500 (-) Transcript_7788:270-1769(-)